MYLTHISPFTRSNDSDWIKYLKYGLVDITRLSEPYIDKEISGVPNSKNYKERHQPDFYKNFALDIITESAFDYPNPMITEKTFRALVCKKIFIIVGPPFTLKLLKDYGFKTFHPIINEDYDKEEHPEKRMIMIQKEILNFCTQNIEDIKNLYKNCASILEHNFNWIDQARQNDLEKVKNLI